MHFKHLEQALGMPGVKRIYLEKPVCASLQEEEKMKDFTERDGEIKIQVGFQYLQTSSVREALQFWKSGKLGKPVHFDLKYYHGDYLQAGYREKRVTRLTPAPDGGAMADLGSHGISLLMAFLGENLQITGALQSGDFPDVPSGSDLFSSLSLLTRIPELSEIFLPAESVQVPVIWFIWNCTQKMAPYATHQQIQNILSIILKAPVNG